MSGTRCRLCDETEQGITYHGPLHDRTNWKLWPEMREKMLRAHHIFECGPGGKELLRENGYLYDAAYLREQNVLLFHGDREWLHYMTGEREG